MGTSKANAGISRLDESTPATRRLLIAVDAERYSAQNDPGQLKFQKDLVEVLKDACGNAGLDRMYWQTQATGDGELALLPPGVDETRVIDDFVRELDVSLYQRNRGYMQGAKLRLRVAIHQGITHLGENGFAGGAVVKACRLLDAPPLKAALKQHPDVDLVLIVSDQIYEDVIAPNFRSLRAESFREVRVTIPEKGFTADAWIHVPAGRRGGDRGAEEGAVLTVRDPQGQTSRYPLRGYPVLIGRMDPTYPPPPDVPIDDQFVGREHCRLTRIRGRWHLVVPPREERPPKTYPLTVLRRGQTDRRIEDEEPVLLYANDVILLPATWTQEDQPRWWELHFSDRYLTGEPEAHGTPGVRGSGGDEHAG